MRSVVAFASVSKSIWLQRFFVCLLFVWFVVYFISLTGSVVRSFNALPEMDYWETVPHLDGYKSFPPKVLWEQHYEHRVVFPEIIFALDWLLLGGRGVMPLALIGVLDLGLWGLLLLGFRKRRQLLDGLSWSAVFLSGIAMFWPGVAFVLAFPFSLQWLLFQFSATASFLALARNRFLLAMVLATIASFSSANGLVVWPILLAMTLVLRMGRRKAIAIASCGTVAIFVFFVGYRNLGNSHPALVWAYPLKSFGYFVSYLGMPLGAGHTGVAIAAGSGSILLLLTMSYLAWRRGLIRDEGFLVPAGVAIVTLATGLVISTARIPFDRPFAQAVETPGRYVNFGAHYWAALIVLTLVVLSSMGRKVQWTAIAVFSLVLGATLSQNQQWIRIWMNQYALYQSATLALEAGVAIDSAAQTLNYADGGLVKRSLAELERRHLALYASGEYKQIGKQVTQVPRAIEAAQTAVTWVQAVPGGFQIVGRMRLAGRRLLVVDGAGTTIGFGAHLGAGLPIGIPLPPGPESEYFLAYAGPTFLKSQAHFFVFSTITAMARSIAKIAIFAFGGTANEQPVVGTW